MCGDVIRSGQGGTGLGFAKRLEGQTLKTAKNSENLSHVCRRGLGCDVGEIRVHMSHKDTDTSGVIRFVLMATEVK